MAPSLLEQHDGGPSRHSRGPAIALFLLLVALLGALGFLTKKMVYSNDIGSLFSEDDADYQFFQSFGKTFGSDEAVLVGVQDGDIFTAANLDFIHKATEALTAVDGIKSVSSLSSISLAYGQGDRVEFKKVVPEGDLTPAVLASVKATVMGSPTFAGRIVSRDGTMAVILATTRAGASHEAKTALIDHVRSTVNKINNNHLSLTFAGPALMDLEFVRLRSRDLQLLPLALAIALLMVLAWLLRDWLLALAVSTHATLVVVLTMAAAVLIGTPFNVESALVLPVLFILAVITGLGAVIASEGTRASVALCRRNVLTGVLFLSGLGIAFCVPLAVGRLLVLKVMAAYLAGGLVLNLVVAYGLLPVFLRHSSQLLTVRLQGSMFGRCCRAAAAWGSTKRAAMLGLVFVVFGIGIVGMTRLRFDTNLAGLLPSGNQVKVDHDLIDHQLFGTVPLNLVLTAADDEHDFTQPASLRTMDRLTTAVLQRFPGEIAMALSLVDYYKQMNQSFNGGGQNLFELPQKRAEIVDYSELIEMSDSKALAGLVTPERKAANISFAQHGYAATAALDVAAFLQQQPSLGEGLSYRLTGVGALYARVDTLVRENAWLALGVAVPLVGACLAFVAGISPVTLIGTVLTLLPVVAVLGAMGFSCVPIDVAAILLVGVGTLISAVLMRPLLRWFAANPAEGDSQQGSFAAAVGAAGAMAGASVCLFSALLFSSFQHIRYFAAGFMAISVVAALVCLVVLPAALAWRRLPG